MAFTGEAAKHRAVLRVSALAYAERAEQENACVRQRAAKMASVSASRSPLSIASSAVAVGPFLKQAQAPSKFGSRVLSRKNFG